MNKREQAKREAASKRFWDERNARIRADQAKWRAEILAARPGWDAAKLDAVRHSYRGASGEMGLSDILEAVRTADALAAKFGGAA